MNKNIIKTILTILPAIGLMACSENYWNDKYLDGFEEGPSYSSPSTGSATLTADDYSVISSLLLAQSKNATDSAAARAIKTNNYFDATSPWPAKEAIPYYLASTSSQFFNFASGSTADISYVEISSTPEEIALISATAPYTLNADDYKTVWGSESDFINAFSPSHPASDYVPSILKSHYADAVEGNYAIVSYNVASENPVFGTAEGGYEISDNIKNLELGQRLNATAVVTAQSSRGLILTDNAGSILYYNQNIDLSLYPIGTVVKISGEIAQYNNGFQFSAAANIEVVGEEMVTYPEPVNFTASKIDAACAGNQYMTAQYISMQGELSISGNYYNIIVDGASAQGSVYYATPEILSMLENGKSYIFEGYFSSYTSKYLYLIVTNAIPLIDVELTDAIKGINVGDKLNSTAVVTAQCSRGLILTDNGGSILYYDTAVDLSQYPLGTAVKVSGDVSMYNKGLQLSNSATIEILGRTSYNYPSPKIYTAAMMDEAVAGTENITAQYVQLTGSLTISGSYYNIIVAGTETQGSVYYPVESLAAELESGKEYTFTGYFTSFKSPYFYVVVTEAVPVASSASYLPPTRATIFSPVSSVENEVYYYNGSSWSKATDVAVLNPSDYEAMGDSNNNVTSPAVKIPLYLKANYPYAVNGDMMFVAYNLTNNGCTCNLFVYNGSEWSLNNNGKENLTGQFKRNGENWVFSKYIGKSIFTLFTDNEIILNRKYMIAYGTAAATPVPTSNSYGYLQKTDVSPEEGMITMNSDDNAFEFATSCTYNGNEYYAPEGQFLLHDANGRYLYLQGTYTSFNVRADNPYISDGEIEEGYLWTATNNGDGSWTIENVLNGKKIFFSSGYSNFAAYDSKGDNDSYPSLYILDED